MGEISEISQRQLIEQHRLLVRTLRRIEQKLQTLIDRPAYGLEEYIRFQIQQRVHDKGENDELQ